MLKKTDIDLLRADIDLVRVELEKTKAELQIEIQSAKAEVIKWVAGMLVAQAAIVATIVKLLYFFSHLSSHAIASSCILTFNECGTS